MTNLVFVEHKKIPKQQAKAIRQDLLSYAISVALAFPVMAITQEEKIKVAKIVLRDVFKEFDLSTKNLGTIIHDQVRNSLQNLYVSLKRHTSESKKELLDMICVVQSLQRKHPKKYEKLFNSLQNQLNKKQQAIFDIYFKFKPKQSKKNLSYKTVSKLSRIPVGTIKGQMKVVVKMMDKLFRSQKIKHGR